MTRALIGAALLLAATSLAPVSAQTITLAMNQDIRSSDPGVNRDGNTDEIVLHVVEGLMGYGEDGEIGPLLASRVDVSPDRLTYSFTLRHDVTFHDGTKLTSAQVLWSWNRYMDARTGWRCKAFFDGSQATRVVSASAPSPDSFVMTLAAPDATFLDTLALPDCGGTGILSPASLKPDGSWDHPVGTGPFVFGTWKRGQSLTLDAFPGYVSPPGEKRNGYLGNKKPLVQGLRILAIPDDATVKAGLESGAIDIAPVPPNEVAELRAQPNLAVEVGTDPVRHSIIMQTRDPLLRDVRIRQALAAALDDRMLVDAVSNGLGTVNNSPIYLTSRYYGPVEKQGFVYDPQRARQLLKEAGYHGQPITIIANQRSSMPSFDTAVLAQQMWQAVGINVQISTMDWATQLDKYNSGNYMMQATSFSPRFDPALGFEQIIGPKDTQPRKIWENPQAIALTAKAMQTTDPVARQAIFDTLHKMQIDDVPVIFTHNGLSVLAHSKHITGLRPWAAIILWGVGKS